MDTPIECVPNFSEGRDAGTIEAIVAALCDAAPVRLLGRSLDPDHNRTVVTFAGEPAQVEAAALAAVERAAREIDLREHRGVHPRRGATDVLPFTPLSGASMSDAVELARRVGRRIGSELEIPVFLYDEAALRAECRDLARVRATGNLAPDFGPPEPHPSAGATAVGARFFLLAYNVNLASDDVTFARRIARGLRERNGGLPGVKALGFSLPERGLAQVSMNLTDYRKTGLAEAFAEVERLARELGVSVLESELVGLAPADALSADTAERIRLRDFDPDRQILERALARGAS